MNKVMLKKFFWWMNERHRIYLKKEAGEPWPWTKDKILQEYKFTNVYRNLDTASKELHYLVDMSLKNHSMLLFQICLFRIFNVAETYQELTSEKLQKEWDPRLACTVLDNYKNTGGKVFTGAYMMCCNLQYKGHPKHRMYCEDTLTNIWNDRFSLVRSIKEANELAWAVHCLRQYTGIAEFVGYEIATDLRHTAILNNATDIMSWANPGPGAKRGLNRICKRNLKFNQPNKRFISEMEYLLNESTEYLEDHMEPLEMRDIEHSLCEFDKYMRVKNGEGRPRSKYRRSV